MQSRSQTRRQSGPLNVVHGCAVLYSALLVLGVICLSWTLLALPLYLLLPRRAGTAAGRFGIMTGFRLFAWYLSFVGMYRLDLHALDALRGGPPLILAPNHPSMVDALLILTRHPNIACVMKKEILANVFMGSGARLARYVCNDRPLQMIREAVADLARGGTLLLFPEGTRSVQSPINPLTSSIGVIAKQAAVPVQTLIIESDTPFLAKGWTLFRRPALPITYRVRLGKRFAPPEDVRSFVEELDAYYRAELAEAPQSQWLGKVASIATGRRSP
jgi:1-acyl-sn-glycerol-3-phosphate acyltransferase